MSAPESSISLINSKRLIFVFWKSKNAWDEVSSRCLSMTEYKTCFKGHFNNGKDYLFGVNEVKIRYGREIRDDKSILEASFGCPWFEGYELMNGKIFLLSAKGELSIVDQNHQIERTKEKILRDAQIKKEIEEAKAKERQEKAQILTQQKERCKAVFDYYCSLANSLDKEMNIVGDDGMLVLFNSYQYHLVENKWANGLFTAITDRRFTSSPCPPFITPFGFNESQLKALKMALSKNVSVINGPPGTGKTQTILSIIASAIINNKSVAVVSNNNKAVDNVAEKLDALGFSYIYARLGNKDTRDSFFQAHHELPKFETKPNNSNSLGLDQLYAEVAHLFAVNKEYESAKAKYYQFLEESKNEKKTIPTRKVFFFENTNDPYHQCLSLSAKLEKRGKDHLRFLQRILFGMKNLVYPKVLKGDLSELSSYLIKVATFYKEVELKTKYFGAKTKKATLESKGLGNRIKTMSLDTLKMALYNRYHAMEEPSFDSSNYKDSSSAFLYRFPVILSSTFSLPVSMPHGVSVDYLIVDEASQSPLTPILPSLALAKHLVVIGDECQLSPIISPFMKESEEKSFLDSKVPPSIRDNGVSLLDFVKQRIPDSSYEVTLSENYRSYSNIVEFSNRRFYGGELIAKKPDIVGPHLHLVVTAEGHHARKNMGGTGLYNLREIDEVKRVVNETKDEYKSIAVITPYRRQRELLSSSLSSNVDIGTVHTFQGREDDEVIFSTVANDAKEYKNSEGEMKEAFISNEELINVAITRAKEEFVLVTSEEIASSKSGILSDLVKYIRYKNGLEEDGTIRSIFDLLYSDYGKSFNLLLSESESIAEILFAKALTKALHSNKDFVSLRFLTHVPLHSFLYINKLSYSEEEYRYLTHPWTHVDFLVINEYDKEPVVAFEVDGVGFHEQNKKQSIHDSIKDKAFTNARLSIVRFKTNETVTTDKIVEAIKTEIE